MQKNTNKSRVEWVKLRAFDVTLPALSGLQSVSQLHLAEVHPEGLLEERDIAAAMETAQTQRSGTEQQHSRQQGLTTISLEEQKILRSLERLNHQLFCEHSVKADGPGCCDLHTTKVSTCCHFNAE